MKRGALEYQLFQLRPSYPDLASIDGVRHPGVVAWVDDNAWRDRIDAQSILWIRGYHRFGSVFEQAYQLDPFAPETKLADPWYLAGLRTEDFTPTTRAYITRTFHSGEAGTSSLIQFINTFHKKGNLPDNFNEQVAWAGGRSIPQTTIWSSWAQGVLGAYARTWDSENIDELMQAGMRRRELDKALSFLYGVPVEYVTNISQQRLPDVEFAAVRAYMLEGVPAEFVRAALV